VKKKKRRHSGNGSIARDVIMSNVYAAYRDESYGIIARCVEETLKDPELKEKITRYARAIFKAIAEKM